MLGTVLSVLSVLLLGANLYYMMRGRKEVERKAIDLKVNPLAIDDGGWVPIRKETVDEYLERVEKEANEKHFGPRCPSCGKLACATNDERVVYCADCDFNEDGKLR